MNKFSAIPLYNQLSNYIGNKIKKGILKPGELLPSEKEMATRAGVSTVVVRQAYSRLRKESLISTQRGKGTFVSNTKPTFEFVQKLVSSYEEAIIKGQKISTEVIELKEIFKFNNDIKYKLKLSEGDHLIMITRLRSINDVKMFFWTSYLPASICKSLLQEDFTKESLYKILKKKYNLEISRAERYIEVVKADSYKAEILSIPEFEPLFFIESISYTSKNEPIEYYHGWYITNNTKFYFEVR